MKIFFTVIGALGIALLFVKPLEGQAESQRVFYSSPDFEITENDLKLYLGAELTTNGVKWGSPEQVQIALSELYTLKVLGAEADRAGFLTEEEKAWIAYYEVALAGVKKLTASRVSEAMETVDWEAEAREYYIANKQEFMTREEITVRTLLLTTESRTLLEALTLATAFVDETPSIERFSQLVQEHTDDPNNKDGVIPNLRKGKTVKEFETAAFALEEVGEVSTPVVSMYGVHVIQLLDKPQRQTLEYDKVKPAVIAELKKRRANQFATFAKQEPHRTPPEDVVIHESVIEQFLQEIASSQAADQSVSRSR